MPSPPGQCRISAPVGRGSRHCILRPAMEATVDAVLEALARRDAAELRRLLHPYVRWTDASGTTMRGRTKVLARLLDGGPFDRPRAVELRDGQVHRWDCS